ncbi:hypothetical protein [Streptomyces prunicolor]
MTDRLAHNDGHLIDDSDWDHASCDLRKDYLDLARTTLTVLSGPTEAQQQVAALTAEVWELTRQRDRYREAWRSASRGRSRARQTVTKEN